MGNKEKKLKFQKFPFSVDAPFEKDLFVSTPLIVDDLNELKNIIGDPIINRLLVFWKSLLKHAMIFNTLP